MAQPRVVLCEEDIAEWQRLDGLVDQNRNPRVAQEIGHQIQKLRTELNTLRPAPVTEARTASPSSLTDAGTTKRNYISLTNFAWDQTTKEVKIYITLTDIDATDNVQLEFAQETLEVKALDIRGKDYRFHFKRLAHPVDTNGCRHRVKKGMIVITLKKAKWNWWDSVEHKDPVLPRRSPKEKEEASQDPGASMLRIMKDLYDSGDDEMKRTIKKAWVEADEKRRTDPAAATLPGDLM